MISPGVTTLVNFYQQIINAIQMYLLLMILHRAQDNNNILLHLGLKLLTSIPQKTQKYLWEMEIRKDISNLMTRKNMC